MKKTVIALLLTVLLGAFCCTGCSASSEMSSESHIEVGSGSEVDTSEYALTDEEEALDFIVENCGTYDGDTGKDYQFEYLDCVEIEGLPFYIYNCNIEGDDGEDVLLDTLFAAADKSGIYSGEYNLDKGTASYNDGMNYLDEPVGDPE